MVSFENILNGLGQICPFCHYTEIKRAGFRQNKKRRVRVYQCKRCNRRFVGTRTRQYWG